ncbi:hypothetical protein J2Y66_003070 [Paenarthrobacter nitroguajacolicus]|nr:hypothetical protein [Paenarthrobacter nitroguajacolicus]
MAMFHVKQSADLANERYHSIPGTSYSPALRSFCGDSLRRRRLGHYTNPSWDTARILAAQAVDYRSL